MDEQKAIESALKKVEAQQENLGGFMDRFDISEHWAVRHVLEKQIAKKVVTRLETRDGYYWKCPICDYDIVRFSYCPNCGQKLDWSEV